jgi:hypothetical protein
MKINSTAGRILAPVLLDVGLARMNPAQAPPRAAQKEREFGTMNGGWGSVWEDMHGKAVLVWCGGRWQTNIRSLDNHSR